MRVPHGRVRVRGALRCDRGVRRRRTHVHRDREPGPALHGRGALQRLRPRPPDRDDGREPRDRSADQHLERPLGRDVAARLWLDPALRGVEPGGRRPPRSGVRPRRGALAPGDGVHGRVRSHARGRARRPPDAGSGGCVPARLRAATGARPGRPGDDRGDGRPRGVHRGQVPHARKADAGARPRPADRRRVRARVRAELRGPGALVPGRRGRDGRRRARLGARDDRRASSTTYEP